jgi:hypothetical protein
MCGGGSGVSGLSCLAAAGPGCGNSWADRADTDRTGFTHPAGGPWRQEQTSPNCSPDRCAGRPRCRGKGGRFGLLRRGRLVNERRSAYRGFAARGRRIGHWAAHDAAEKGIVSPVAARGGHPRGAQSRSRQHARQAADVPVRAEVAGLVLGRDCANHPDQPRRQCTNSHGFLRAGRADGAGWEGGGMKMAGSILT